MIPTPSEINRRLAKYAGYRDIEPHPHYGHLWTGQADDCEQRETAPNYWVDARAVLPLVERVCRERHLKAKFLYDFEYSGVGPVPMVWYARIDDQWFRHGYLDADVKHQSLPGAICLALVAVLDGDQKPNSERTEP